MKLLLRCLLALIAALGSVFVLNSKSAVSAQSCCAQDYCPPPQPNCPNPTCDYLGGCSFAWACDSPIVVDVRGEGFHLTDQANGVKFRFFGDAKSKVSWTDPKFGNAWLAFDRNGNGIIDDASELFGNYTPQPQSQDANGFRALAVYDLPENGGNADDEITAADSIYAHLLLWTDLNHNGISEPNELQSLDRAGITSISLSYSKDNWIDKYGNVFRYRGHDKANSEKYDRRIYDVYLVGTNPQ